MTDYLPGQEPKPDLEIFHCGACPKTATADQRFCTVDATGAERLPVGWRGGSHGCLCPKCHKAGVARVRRTAGPNRAERVKLRSKKYRNRVAKEQRRQEKREARQAAAREKEAGNGTTTGD